MTLTIPLSKPTSFEAMLEDQENKNDPQKPNKISIESVRKKTISTN